MLTRLLTALFALFILYRGYMRLRKFLGWTKPDKLNQKFDPKNRPKDDNVVELKRDPKDGVFRPDDDDDDDKN